jgi:hypothetical protein
VSVAAAVAATATTATTSLGEGSPVLERLVERESRSKEDGHTD